MKKIILAILLTQTPVVNAGLSHNNMVTCYRIKDKDWQNLCLAEAKQEVSYCYNISDVDKRFYCQGEFVQSNCYNIQDYNLKQYCLTKRNNVE